MNKTSGKQICMTMFSFQQIKIKTKIKIFDYIYVIMMCRAQHNPRILACSSDARTVSREVGTKWM